MDEFSLIDRYFKPLAAGFPGALSLADDAAVVTPPPGYDLVITKDAVSAGVHFIGDEAPELVAKKLLRVNLSDIAAMGATPLCYFLAIMLPELPGEEWLSRFCAGLAADQQQYGIHLAGGDTIATKGALSFSVTAIGSVPAGQALKRSGAQPGDRLFVSGTLGDSALGLSALQSRHNEFLIQRYLLPEPRVTLGMQLIGVASAAMDISDGLMQDLGHLCCASGMGAAVQRDRLPLSQPARALVKENASLWDTIIGGGDDYELLFTVPPERLALLPALETPIAEIGVIESAGGVRLFNAEGNPLPVTKAGFSHF